MTPPGKTPAAAGISRLPSAAPPTRREAFSQLVASLDRLSVPYCLVGDVKLFPDEVRKDVDILAGFDSFPAVLAFVQAFCAETRADLIQLIQYERNGWYFCLAWTDAEKRVSLMLVDFCRDFCQDARFFLSGAEVLEGRVWEPDPRVASGGYYVPAPAIQFIYYLIKRIDKGVLTPAQAAPLSARWSEDPAGARRQLERFWRGDEARLLAEAARTGAWDSVLAETARLRAALHRNVPITPRGHLEEARLRWRRLCAPPGVSIGLAGGDPNLLNVITGRLHDTFGSAFYHFRALDAAKPSGPTRAGRVWRRVERAAASLGTHRLDLGRAALLVSRSGAIAAPVDRNPGKEGSVGPTTKGAPPNEPIAGDRGKDLLPPTPSSLGGGGGEPSGATEVRGFNARDLASGDSLPIGWGEGEKVRPCDCSVSRALISKGANPRLDELFALPLDLGFFLAPLDTPAPGPGATPDLSPPGAEAGQALPRPWIRLEFRGSTEDVVREIETRLVQFLAGRLRRRLMAASRCRAVNRLP